MKDYKTCGELRKKAMLAKQRMKMGYWQKLKKDKEVEIRLAEYKMMEAVVPKIDYTDSYIVENYKQESLDEILYSKVTSILEEDEDVTNPIGRLVNRQEYEILDDTGKNRYILQLSAKFREMRERYYKEKQNKYMLT